MEEEMVMSAGANESPWSPAGGYEPLNGDDGAPSDDDEIEELVPNWNPLVETYAAEPDRFERFMVWYHDRRVSFDPNLPFEENSVAVGAGRALVDTKPVAHLCSEIFGLAEEDVLVSHFGFWPLPAPPGRRHKASHRIPQGLKLAYAGHPVFFLDEDTTRQRVGESDDLYIARLWAALDACNFGDMATGALVNVLEAVGLAPTAVETIERLGVWREGSEDPELAGLELPAIVDDETGQRVASDELLADIADVLGELNLCYNKVAKIDADLANTALGEARQHLSSITAAQALAPFDQKAELLLGAPDRSTFEKQVVELALETTDVFYALATRVQFLADVSRAQARGDRWYSYDAATVMQLSRTVAMAASTIAESLGPSKPPVAVLQELRSHFVTAMGQQVDRGRGLLNKIAPFSPPYLDVTGHPIEDAEL